MSNFNKMSYSANLIVDDYDLIIANTTFIGGKLLLLSLSAYVHYFLVKLLKYICEFEILFSG